MHRRSVRVGNVHLSTFFIYACNAGAGPRRAILDRRGDAREDYGYARGAQTRAGAARTGRLIVLLLLLFTPLPNRAKPVSLRVPFRSVQAMILVEVKVNGTPATFVVDTGANRTIISTKAFGNAQVVLPRWPRNPKNAGLISYSQRLPADLTIGERVWFAQPVSVVDLEELKGMLKLDFDGLLGEDILRQFRSIRIDYHTHILEMEE